MKSLLFHSFEAKSTSGQRRKVLSIFVACHNLSDNEFDTSVAVALSREPAPDAVYITGYQEDIQKVRSWLTQTNNATAERLRTLIDIEGNDLCLISFDNFTGTHVARRLDSSEIADTAILSTDRQLSLLGAFRAAGGEQRAPTGTHFAKTSDSHSERFLRVSNVLEEGANVRLIAFWLMPHLWKVAIDSVIVDTSGIYSIALTAIHEASIRGGLLKTPLVWSHKSHEGVTDIASHQASNALCLVSASTSGGLVQRLKSQGIELSRIVTLFSLAKPSTDSGHVLCDLIGPDGEGIERIENHEAAKCPLCKKHFHLIRLQGDQFSISPPNVALLEIKATDLSDQIKAEAGAILGLGAFVAYRRSADGRTASLGLRVDPILDSELSEKNRAVLCAKRERWAELVRRSSSVSTRHVVAGSYPGSQAIAKGVAETIRSFLREGDRPTVVTPEQLRNSSSLAKTSTIVVAAGIEQTKELLSVSRTLRDVQEDGSTSYLAIADMIGSKSERDRLRSNLTFGQHGPGTFSLHTLFCLPLDCYEENPSWDAEVQELKRVMDWADNHEIEIPEDLERRIQYLQKAPAEGIIENIFWPAPEGCALALRSDFTLIRDARRDPPATQADLLAVMSLILTALRHSTDVNRRLAYNAYERVMLSPHNFDRFNDGILQASLLRSAHPQELAYGACEISISEQMLDVLIHALPDGDVPEKSEAFMEFLIALLTRRMSLHTAHLLEICERVTKLVPISDIRGLIASYMLDRERKC
ncbi:hypothetical protein [Paracidovorax oryzae]|uniref:hypothetical protein n=1 Tax=Paracidovorax oryzae TaxID=862720 RepID=UPI00030C0202|nr:hypothetical protein [Paracidovorax oryzae]